jgi:ABC-type proline/glycine betaine transport system permease subunit
LEKDWKMKHESLEAASAVASKVTYTGAGGAVIFGLTANEVAALVGASVAVMSLIVNIVFKYLAHQVLVKHSRDGKPLEIEQ